MIQHDEIKFSDQSENYCVCIIDIVNSTLVTARITNPQHIRKYYSIFINTMATIARNFEGRVIKNSGDSVVYYFPNTSDSANECAFRNVLECCLTLIAAHSVINDKLYEEALPEVRYRISADYGKVQIAQSNTSLNDDLFGTTLNVCAKINKLAKPNSMVIGGDLHRILKSLSTLRNDYDLKPAGFYSVGIEQAYPLYTVTSRYDEPTIGDFMQIPELKPSQAHLRGRGQLRRIELEQNQSRNYSYKVMLVDDDKDILATFQAILSSEDVEVEAFNDSTEALKQFAIADSNPYHLVILDIRMPGLNGLQLYYRLKAVDRNIKVLFVSALDASEELISILPEVQLANILKKPVDRDHFISTVKANLSDITERRFVTDH
jgi:two-component system, OmpR family, response regulator ChvI